MKKIIAYFLSILMMAQPYIAHSILYRGISSAMSIAIPGLAVNALMKSGEALAQTTPLGVAEGKAIANSSMSQIKNNLPTMDPSSRTTISMPSTGNTAVQSDLVQQRNAQTGDAAAVAAAYGNEGVYDSLVGGVTSRLGAEPSTQGDAFRTMIDSKKRRADYSNAAFLDRSKDVMNTPFTGCTQSETVTSAPRNVDLSETKNCTRAVNAVAACNVKRLYTVSAAPVTGDCAFHTMNSLRTDYWSGNRNSGVYEDYRTVSIDWSKVSSVTLNTMYCDDDCEIQYYDLDRNEGWYYVPNATSLYGMNLSEGCPRERGGAIYLSTPADLTPYFYGRSNLRLKIVHCVAGGGVANVQIQWNSNVSMYQDQGMLQSPSGCWDAQFSNSYCHADSWTCNDQTAKYAGPQRITIDTVKGQGGKEIWQDNTPYVNSEFEGTGGVCWNADAVGLCSFGGPTTCFTDVNGVQQCPNNDGSTTQDTCQALEDEGCVFESETCVAGATDPNTGTCMAYTGTYKCGGQTVAIGGNVSTSTTLNCAATRCMGSECTDVSNEQNSSFGMLNGLLGNINSMGQDGQCDASGCVLFGGKDLRCKNALGGLFDCCNKSVPGVNWMDYMKLGHASYKAAQMQGWISQMPSLSGIGTQIGNSAISTANDLIGKEFFTPFDAIEAGSSTGAGPLSSLTSELMSQATTQLRDWVANQFGLPDLATSLFAETSPGVYSFNSATTSMMNSVMTTFMWVYVAYLILSIIFACVDSEFELAASKQMKACHYIGSYCSGKTLGICWETKQTFCCYSSALSRIMQEQIRMQMMGWGSPENPRCEGISPATMSSVNWDLVNLDEYVAMMTLAGIKPGSGQEAEFYGMDNITKTNVGGSSYSVSRGSGSPGVNAVDALQQATQSTATTGANVDTIRMNATQNATSLFPPAN